MKSFHNLLFGGLIAAVVFWHSPEQVPGDVAAANPIPPSTSTPNSPVAPYSHTSVNPDTPGNSNMRPAAFSMSMTIGVMTTLLLSLCLLHFGSDSGVVKSVVPSRVLKGLIREVENSSGYTRNDARAKAKAWLEDNVASLGENEIFLAKTHFSYLLPPNWGAKA
jgi:hypothetical protein